jgi:hypothetical protein
MAANLVTPWAPAQAKAAWEDAAAACPAEGTTDLSPGRRLGIVSVLLAAGLLMAAPAITAVFQMVDQPAAEQVAGWARRLPVALSLLVAWRVPGALILVVALSRLRRHW